MYTLESPVPADQLRQLPTRDVALLLLQSLACSNDYLQYPGTMGSVRAVARYLSKILDEG